MKSNKRRDMLKGATALLVGGAAGQALPTAAAETPRTPFMVPMTYIPIAGSSDMFPVRRIYCIGRNYAAHSREMGSDPTREPPFFFQKPTDAVQWGRPARRSIIRIRPSPRTTITRSSSSRRSTRADATSRSTARSSTCSATRWVST